jgi:hypothetical protein
MAGLSTVSVIAARMRARLNPFVVERAGVVALCWMLAVAYGAWLGTTSAGGIPCLWKTLLGLECPGCGLTHAWAFLLRGDVAAAVRANWLVFPVLAGFSHHSLVFAARRQPLFLATLFNH